MQKSGIALFVFFFGITVSVAFQNCGQSALRANSSDTGDGLRVDVVDNSSNDPNGNGNSNDGSNSDGDFSFDLNNGDNIFFVSGGGMSLNLSTSRILAKLYYSMMESTVYEQRDTTFTQDLPSSYCNNSALPHCAHMSAEPCVGLGCYKSTTPVRCHWQKRMSTAEINNTFDALNSLEFLTRSVSPEDPMIADCNSPLLHFYQQNKTLDVSLANPACVPDSSYYAINSSGDNIKAIFNNELDNVSALTNNQGDPEFCNNYSSYAWDSTLVEYKSHSGLTMDANSSFRFEMKYEARTLTINGQTALAGAADLIFKEAGSDALLCANSVPVQPTELDVLFPSDGLQYQIYRTDSAVSDISTAEVKYEDPVDGGATWKLYLDQGTAMTYTGGAIMDQVHADAIKDLVETVLVNRAKTSGMAQPCPPST